MEKDICVCLCGAMFISYQKCRGVTDAVYEKYLLNCSHIMIENCKHPNSVKCKVLVVGQILKYFECLLLGSTDCFLGLLCTVSHRCLDEPQSEQCEGWSCARFDCLNVFPAFTPNLISRGFAVKHFRSWGQISGGKRAMPPPDMVKHCQTHGTNTEQKGKMVYFIT